MTRPQKITSGEMRESGVRGVLIYCSDYHCSHHITASADQWPDHIRLSDFEPSFHLHGLRPARRRHQVALRLRQAGSFNRGRLRRQLSVSVMVARCVGQTMEVLLGVLICLAMSRRTWPSPCQPESPSRVCPINGGYRKQHDKCGAYNRRATHARSPSSSQANSNLRPLADADLTANETDSQFVQQSLSLPYV